MRALLNFVLRKENVTNALPRIATSSQPHLSMGAYGSFDSTVIGPLYPCCENMSAMRHR